MQYLTDRTIPSFLGLITTAFWRNILANGQLSLIRTSNISALSTHTNGVPQHTLEKRIY
jgi:hypothetical protein